MKSENVEFLSKRLVDKLLRKVIDPDEEKHHIKYELKEWSKKPSDMLLFLPQLGGMWGYPVFEEAVSKLEKRGYECVLERVDNNSHHKISQMNLDEGTVDHPSYYNRGAIEAIEIIEDWDLGFHRGNIIKYILRSTQKSGKKEDLKKAKWYIKRLLQGEEE